MRNSNKKVSETHLNKIKYYTDYKISESPKYRPLVGEDEEFDEIPSNDDTVDTTNNPPEKEKIDVPVPDFDKENNNPNDIENNVLDNQNVTPENNVNIIQNDIIKHNIEAMRNINDKLESLASMVDGLNGKINDLNSEVEEVREPSNGEKLMNKTNVSYPYYFNLNDFWSDNWFNKKREENNEKGIRELPDGSYIADFDDLPKSSKYDLDKSFDTLI